MQESEKSARQNQLGSTPVRLNFIENKSLEKLIMISKKSRLVTLLLAAFLGFYAVDLFFLGKTKQAVLQLILAGATWACIAIAFVMALFSFLFFPAIIALFLDFLALCGALGGLAWQITRIVTIACGKATDKDGNLITEWNV